MADPEKDELGTSQETFDREIETVRDLAIYLTRYMPADVPVRLLRCAEGNEPEICSGVLDIVYDEKHKRVVILEDTSRQTIRDTPSFFNPETVNGDEGLPPEKPFEEGND